MQIFFLNPNDFLSFVLRKITILVSPEIYLWVKFMKKMYEGTSVEFNIAWKKRKEEIEHELSQKETQLQDYGNIREILNFYIEKIEGDRKEKQKLINHISLKLKKNKLKIVNPFIVHKTHKDNKENFLDLDYQPLRHLWELVGGTIEPSE